MSTSDRPLSPHLQVYRPQLTSMTSFLHRFTGIVLSLGTIILVLWLSAAAGTAEQFAAFNGIWSTWWGMVLAIGWLAALNYHLLNGIRHLFWDAGKGLDIPTAYKSGWAVLIGTVVLTALVWFGAAGGAA